jgi:hypothetical protein
MNSKTFNGITPEIFEEIKGKLSEYGLNLVGPKGSVSKMGVSMNYEYSEADSQLALQNVEVGFPASLAGYSSEKILTTLEKELATRGIG